MSYQVLARKWRPAAFEEMVGQSHVLHALTNALGQQRLHHAYLFTGTRGVGKTSIARLFAKGLNCEQGVTAKPCGTCSSCVEIAQGRFVDLIEVDAASRTKVDDTRELLDNVQYRPTRGRFKVYLIDEVHMLSRSSFNALLKTLEEPPEHVKFLLATTDPQKLPVTVLSRCLQFNLKSLSQDEIAKQLSHVLSQESIPAEPQALTLLAKAANGSMRDGLSLTDQAIAFGAGSISLEQVQTMLGSIDERHVLGLFEALVSTDIQQVLKKVAEVLAFGADATEVLRSLLELLHQITLTQFAPAAAQMSLYEEQIKAFASQLNPEQVQLYYQILLSGRKELPYAPDPKSGLEMALMRVIAFSPVEGEKNWSTAPSVSRFSGDNEQLGGSEVGDDKVTIAGIKPEKNETEESCDEDERLVSEQALILSQAQSQGFSPAGEQVKARASESETAEIDVAISETAAAQDLEAKVVKPPVLEPKIVGTQGEETQSTKAAVAEDIEAGGATLDNPKLDGLAADASSDNVPLSMYLDHAAPDENDAEYYAAFEEASVPQDKSAQGGVTKAANVSEPPLGDDLLDAVLAARDSLLSDVERDAPKDGDTKKPELKTGVAAKRALPSDANYQASPERLQVQDQARAKEDALLAQGEAKGQTQESPNSHDRPPWEPQPESVPLENGIEQSPALLPAAPEAIVTDANHIEIKPEITQVVSDSTQLESGNDIEADTQETVSEVATRVEQEENLEHRSAPAQLPSTQIVGNEIDLHWYKLMAKLDIGGRVRQLAVNSLCLSLEMPLRLLLKPNQKHLSAEIAIEQLRTALENALEQECQLEIQVGSDADRETPLEIRKRFHQEILGQTQAALFDDTSIQWLQQNMAAELDVDSLSYPPELLAARSGQIESLAFIPEPNDTNGAS